MNTRKMTRAQLRVAIAEKRGWKKSDWFRLEKGKEVDFWDGPDGEKGEELPDYLGDMDEAFVLLRELPEVDLTFRDEIILDWGKQFEGGWVKVETDKEAEAIACAWWQFTTGEVVELVEEL